MLGLIKLLKTDQLGQVRLRCMESGSTCHATLVARVALSVLHVRQRYSVFGRLEDSKVQLMTIMY